MIRLSHSLQEGGGRSVCIDTEEIHNPHTFICFSFPVLWEDQGLGEMFKGDSTDTCAGQFPLMSRGGRAEGLACADTGARTPNGVSGNFKP